MMPMYNQLGHHSLIASPKVLFLWMSLGGNLLYMTPKSAAGFSYAIIKGQLQQLKS